MSAPQWVDGQPSYTMTVTPDEALEEIRKAVKFSSEYADSSQRVRLALALMWAEWKLINTTKES